MLSPLLEFITKLSVASSPIWCESPRVIVPESFRFLNLAESIPKSVVASSIVVLFVVGAINPAPKRKPL